MRTIRNVQSINWAVAWSLDSRTRARFPSTGMVKRAAAAILLLAPSPPLLFMGEEFGTVTPFLFFCEFQQDLAAAVTAGRRNEFARFARFRDPAERERIPDPNDAKTFKASQLNWSVLVQPGHRDWLRFYRKLLGLRREHIVPHLSTG